MEKENILMKVEESVSWEKAFETEEWKEPFTNIFETDDDYVLIVDIPGVQKENLKLKVEDSSLILMARIDYKNANRQNYILRESQVSNYYRKYNLSDSIEIEKTEAELVDGQLKIKLPKHERVKPRTIEIK